jgi:hypothetical protein
MTAPEKEKFLEHWLNIGAERLARYETMYQWTPAADAAEYLTQEASPSCWFSLALP